MLNLLILVVMIGVIIFGVCCWIEVIKNILAIIKTRQSKKELKETIQFEKKRSYKLYDDLQVAIKEYKVNDTMENKRKVEELKKDLYVCDRVLRKLNNKLA